MREHRSGREAGFSRLLDGVYRMLDFHDYGVMDGYTLLFIIVACRLVVPETGNEAEKVVPL